MGNTFCRAAEVSTPVYSNITSLFGEANAHVLLLNNFLYIHIDWNTFTIYSMLYSTQVIIFHLLCSSDKGLNFQNPALDLPLLSKGAPRINHPHCTTSPWEQVTNTLVYMG